MVSLVDTLKRRALEWHKTRDDSLHQNRIQKHVAKSTLSLAEVSRWSRRANEMPQPHRLCVSSLLDRNTIILKSQKIHWIPQQSECSAFDVSAALFLSLAVIRFPLLPVQHDAASSPSLQEHQGSLHKTFRWTSRTSVPPSGLSESPSLLQ